MLGLNPIRVKRWQIWRQAQSSFEQILIDVIGPGASGAYFVMDDALQSRCCGPVRRSVVGRRPPDSIPEATELLPRLSKNTSSIGKASAHRGDSQDDFICSGCARDHRGVASSPEWLQISLFLIRPESQRPPPIHSRINWPPALIW